ncbi:MAG: hypothetical protein ACXWZI_03260 [Mycobacterium sp.]
MALLTDDVFVSMPPMPFEYEGSDVVTRFCAALFGAGRRFDLVATRATASRRSVHTGAGLPASATGSACTSSRSAATGSAP